MRTSKATIYHNTRIPIDLSLHKPYSTAFTPHGVDYWKRAMRLTDGTVVTTTTTQKEPLEKELRTEVQSRKKLTVRQKDEVRKRVEFEVGVNETLDSLKKVAARDEIFKEALYSIPGYRLYANSSILETLVSVFLAQNTTFNKYLKIRNLFIQSFGEEVPWDDEVMLFPKRSKLLDLGDELFHDFRLGRQEKYFLSALEHMTEVGIFAHYPDPWRGYVNMMKIYGIGEYTARFIMLFGARQYSLMPLDHTVRELVNELYEIHDNITYGIFDDWARSKFGEEPALAIHTLLTAYWPTYLRDIQSELGLKY